MLPSALQFVKNNWVKIALTWRDRDDNLFISPELLEPLSKHEIPVSIGWSCFFAAAFMLDIYGVYDREDSHNTSEIITDIQSFISDFQPGFIYQFSISNHEFTIIYDFDKSIYYIDYYMETERDKTENYPLFRLESMAKEAVISYLQSYLEEDFESFTTFHHGSSSFHDEYVKEYFYGKSLDNSKINFYQLSYTKYKITKQPTVSSVLDTVLNNLPTEDMISMQFPEPEQSELCFSAYKFLIDALKDASK
jgi:hypothetical protein